MTTASETFQFRLYIADDAPNSAQAIANLRVICNTYLPGRHKIEVIDVFQEPARALAEGILMTPTLLKVSPLPFRRIVGSLSESEPVLQALGLPLEPA